MTRRALSVDRRSPSTNRRNPGAFLAQSWALGVEWVRSTRDRNEQFHVKICTTSHISR